MQKALGIDEDDGGVLVGEVVDDSPAAAGGLEEGDIIVAFDGRRIDDVHDLTRAVRRSEPGEQVDVEIVRAGERRTLAVEVGERENELIWFHGDEDGDVWHWRGQAPVPPDAPRLYKDAFGLRALARDHGWLGIHMQSLGEQLGEYFGVENGEGALITQVDEDSPAAAAGLQAGDVIVTFDGEEVGSVADLKEQILDTEPEDTIAVTILRRAERREVDVTMGEIPEGHALGRHFEYFGPNLSMRGPHHFELHGDDGDVWVHRVPRLESDEIEDLHDELMKMREELDRLREEIRRDSDND
jgi:predicted metalloprotease with PDZ domain